MFVEAIIDEREGDAYQQTNTVRGLHFFNNEELLFLNRVAFNILGEKGCTVIYKDFIEKLILIQDGRFEDKLEFLLDISLGGYK